MLGDPGCRHKVWEALDRKIGNLGKHTGQVVSRWEFQPAAAFHDRENRRNLRSRLQTADVYPVLPT
jgi:hypothetical protein